MKQEKIFKQYKFLHKGFKSENGNIRWKKGKWVKAKDELEMCKNGLHSSEEPYDAFNHIQGEILAEVECRGEHLKDDYKYCWREQRVVKTYKWTKKDSIKLAIFSAELCLKNCEKEYPSDLRLREAIETAKKVLFRDTKANRSAARSAAKSAAESAAESAAWSAESARSAAKSAAWSAAESAAWSAAKSAAWSAESARSAAESAAIKEIQEYFKEIVRGLKEIR